MKTIAHDQAPNGPIDPPANPTGDAEPVELGDDTREIPWAAMQRILNA